MASLGFLFGVIACTFDRNFLVFPDSLWNGLPRPFALLEELVVRANRWPWGVATSALAAAIIVRMKFKGNAWVLATLLGVLIGSMIVRVGQSIFLP
jgi:hypothetical protein